jgi:hypothetical protein
MATLKTVLLRMQHIAAVELDFSGEQSTLDVYSVKIPMHFDRELNEKQVYLGLVIQIGFHLILSLKTIC